MGRRIEPVCRLCRREGTKLYLKGDRCSSRKCPIERKRPAPGMHVHFRGSKMTEYALQLREKQKVKRYYCLMEKQFANYAKKAMSAVGDSGLQLLQFLERRLDNVVRAASFAKSRPQVRQLIRHGHFIVNGRKVTIPSYLLKENDEVTVKTASRDHQGIKEAFQSSGHQPVPVWLSIDKEAYKIKVNRIPLREDIDPSIQERLIIEFYSR